MQQDKHVYKEQVKINHRKFVMFKRKQQAPENRKIVQETKKPEVYKVDDSIIKNLKGNLMSKNKTVKVRSFPASTIDGMTDFIKPRLRRAHNMYTP